MGSVDTETAPAVGPRRDAIDSLPVLDRQAVSWSTRDPHRPEPAMSLPRTVGEILRDHTTLEVESIDRMYLNVYVPGLQYESGVAAFFRSHRGQLFASSALMAPMSRAFVAAIDAFVAEHALPLIAFAKGQRKDAGMAQHLVRFTGGQGLLFVGEAPEKAAVRRTEKRR